MSDAGSERAVDLSSWKPAESLDAVRRELRNAIFHTNFMGTGCRIEGRNEEANQLRQMACNFVAFGINSGLIPPAEGNDWLDAIWERVKAPAKTYMKYLEE